MTEERYNQDFTVNAGDLAAFDVEVTDTETGELLNLTGAAIRWGLSEKATDAAPLVSKSLGAGIAIVDAEAGIFRVTLQPADTANLNGYYHHEAEVSLGGAPETVIRGVGMILPTVLK